MSEELNQKVEEKLEQIIEGKLDDPDSEVEEKVEEKLREKLLEVDDKEGYLDNLDEGTKDRRAFMKVLGLGAAGAALSSMAGAFYSVNEDTGGGDKGGFDIDNTAYGREVSKDVSGNVRFTTLATDTTTGKDGTGTHELGATTSFSATERVVFEKFRADIAKSGSIKFYANGTGTLGTTVTTKTVTDSGTTTTTFRNNRYNTPIFTAKVNQTVAPEYLMQTAYTYNGSTQKCNTYGDTNTSMYTNTSYLTGTGNFIKMGALLYQQANSMSTSKTYTGTFYFRVNGSTFFSTTLQASGGTDATSVKYATTTTNGSFQDPTVTWKVHNQATSHYGSMDVRWGDTATGSVTTPARLADGKSTTRTFTVERNKFTQVYEP